jgi:uncharacterized protein
MKISMYQASAPRFVHMLRNLSAILDKAEAHAEAKKLDAAVPGSLRLIADMFPLARQVQIACDTVKLSAAFLTGKPAQPQEDNETTLEQLQARVRSVITLLEGLTAQDFAGAATRVVSQPRWKGEWMTGADYFIEHTIPNFFFHLTTAYAILRHNGVAIGKRDYLGVQSKRPPAA